MNRTALNLIGLLVIGVLIVATHKPAPNNPPVGKDVTSPSMSTSEIRSKLVGKTFACADPFLATFTAEEAEHVEELVKDSDTTAIKVMALQARVLPIKRGTTVTIEDIDFWKGVERFRVRGNPTSLYTAVGAIK